jgi:hypothetical protein
MTVDDFYPEGKRWWLRLHEKGGKRHDMPAHHKLEVYMDAYLEGAGIADEKSTPLFRTVAGCTGTLTKLRTNRPGGRLRGSSDPCRGPQGDPRAATAGARSPGTAPPAAALRAAEQGTVCTATRLGRAMRTPITVDRRKWWSVIGYEVSMFRGLLGLRGQIVIQSEDESSVWLVGNIIPESKVLHTRNLCDSVLPGARMTLNLPTCSITTIQTRSTKH